MTIYTETRGKLQGSWQTLKYLVIALDYAAKYYDWIGFHECAKESRQCAKEISEELYR